MSFRVTFSTPPSFSASFSGGKGPKADFETHLAAPEKDYFDGSYTYTPTQETQTIPISGKTARSNITINPIPSNYGLITWNGSVLTVT